MTFNRTCNQGRSNWDLRKNVDEDVIVVRDRTPLNSHVQGIENFHQQSLTLPNLSEKKTTFQKKQQKKERKHEMGAAIRSFCFKTSILIFECDKPRRKGEGFPFLQAHLTWNS